MSKNDRDAAGTRLSDAELDRVAGGFELNELKVATPSPVRPREQVVDRAKLTRVPGDRADDQATCGN